MILLYILGTFAFINILYYFLFSRFAFSKNTPLAPSNAPISLLVCAKNEEKNLEENIPLWLAQIHPDFELVLINDASSDNTLEIMEEFQAKDSRIVIVNVENNEAFWGSKKYALTLGIKKAKHQHLVFTDADCAPASTEWLSKMNSYFKDNKQLILGYGGYQKKRSPLNALIRFETLLTATQYFAFAKVKMPYMGVGRNMAYTSTLFYEQKGFMSHMKIKSGDDDLFVNEAATTSNTSICIHPKAFTYSKPKTSWKSWFSQKRRHITSAEHYKGIHQFLLATYFIANVFFWGLSIAVLWGDFWKIGFIIIGIRILIQHIILGKAAYTLKEQNLIPFFLLLDGFLIVVQIVIFISNCISKPTQWE
jgi:glycosyltransferase involved in cell wall biosynthesis